MQITIEDASKILGVSESQIKRWIKDRGLPAEKLNDRHLFNRIKLIEWMTLNNIPFSGRWPEQTQNITADSLCDALSRGGVFYDVAASSKTSALGSVVKLMPLPEKIDRQLLLEVLLAREALASTGLGDGIAIPHPRNPVVFHITEAIVSLCFLERPVEFGAIDQKPVHTLFTLVTPNARCHLKLLSKLAYSLQDPSFQKILKNRGAKEDILKKISEIETRLGALNKPE